MTETTGSDVINKNVIHTSEDSFANSEHSVHTAALEVKSIDTLVAKWRRLTGILVRNCVILFSGVIILSILLVFLFRNQQVFFHLIPVVCIAISVLVILNFFKKLNNLYKSWTIDFLNPMQRLLQTITLLEANRLELLPEEKKLSITSEHQRKIIDIARNILEHQQFVDQVVDNMFEMMFQLNPDGVILKANKSACMMTKYEQEDLIGQHIRKLFPRSESLLDYYLELEIAFTSHGEVRDMEVYVQTAQGEILPISINGVKVESKYGDLLGYTLIAKNMTEIFRLINALNKSNFDLNKAHSELEKRYDQIKKEIEQKEGQRRILEHEIATSLLVQKTFLPQLASKHQFVSAVGTSVPAAYCGGDWWNTLTFNNKFYVFIGDVTGHGTASAMVTAAVSGYYVSLKNSLLAGENLDVDTILAGFDAVLGNMVTDNVSYNMTCFACVIDFDKKVMRYANAGHNFPLLVRKNEAKLIPLVASGNRLGNKGDSVYEKIEIPIHGGEFIFFYTDGLIENRNSEDEPYGKRRLRKFIESNSAMPVDAFVQRLIKESNEFFAVGKTIEDDVTVVALRLSDLL